TDLTPELLERLAAIDGVAAVKEFSGDVRRVGAIIERTPLAVLCGSDDLALESALMGAVGWVGGVTGARPARGPPRPPRRVLDEGDRARVARQLAVARAGGGDPTGGGR
ncbi:MAG: dihydrodipicolinate synthase family protein, partial [Nitriliruptoraceae bacterium]